MTGWRKIPQAAEHFGVSPRTMRTLLKQGFPHSRLPSGTVLISLKKGDEWLRGFDVPERDQHIVDDILKEFRR